MTWPKPNDPNYEKKTKAYYARQKQRMEDPEYKAKVYARRAASQAKLKKKREAEKKAAGE
ncbi:hypothetical protein PP404_25070 [Mycobacteroides abscessus]|nr:hypothetical protein [Mycobacteroides abscessus]MDM2180495.1 hypothetical protein [Mycobacteroides abscessus]MDM2209711.1 hypothetical protein [Mycobacteroides abscessus]MDM2214737.1 hypothetical protein [Mycobacteroides abscessus]MDM2219728.1 hypothetical protein [Mycobacteroides abscessus]